MGSLEAPTAILSATAGIGFAAFGLGKDTHIDLLYKSQVNKRRKKKEKVCSRVVPRDTTMFAGTLSSIFLTD